MANYDSAFTGAQIDAALTKANSATQPGDLGTAAATAATDYATAAQGALAASATQPGDLGTAAATAATDYATAAQGLLADSAAQPATTLAGYGITDAQPLATVLLNTTAAFTTGQANAIIANTAKVTNATHTGDATGGTALTVTGINGTSLAGLATGLLKNTTSTGVPSIALNSDLPAMTATVGGAVPTPPNNTTTFLRGDGTFAAPPGGGSITSVTGTAPIASSGGDTPAISIIPATGSVPGSMSAADKTKLDAISGTNTGDQTSIVGITGTKAQFDTAVTDGDILYVGDSIASTAISDSTTAGRAFLTAATAAAQRTLLNVADGATANASDAALRDRATHTGTQAAGTITGLAAVATSGSATDITVGTLPAARFNDTAHGARAGGTLHANAVAAGAAGFMTGADKTKLDGVATGATANSADATLLARANHTGTQAQSTVTGLVADLTAKAGLATAQNFTAAQGTTPVGLTDAANIATNAALSNNFTVTLAGNRTLDNPTNVVAGRTYTWVVTQDGTGSRTLAYGTAFDFPGGTAPTLSTAANSVDMVVGLAISTTRILCTAQLAFS